MNLFSGGVVQSDLPGVGALHSNVMLSDDGHPILMDFGSTIKARIHIENRNQALMQQVSPFSEIELTIPSLIELASIDVQDLAAEQSTMPYRAPELFDVKTGTTIDEKVDIWVSDDL